MVSGVLGSDNVFPSLCQKRQCEYLPVLRSTILTLCRDSRIPALIRNGVQVLDQHGAFCSSSKSLQDKKRSFIVVVGDRAKDVIVHLHFIMSSVDIKQNKSVLWAYKKDLIGFSRCVGVEQHSPKKILTISN